MSRVGEYKTFKPRIQFSSASKSLKINLKERKSLSLSYLDMLSRYEYFFSRYFKQYCNGLHMPNTCYIK